MSGNERSILGKGIEEFKCRAIQPLRKLMNTTTA